MREHVKILGILNIVLGCFGALAGIVVLLIFGGLAGIVGASGISAGDYDNTAVAVPVLTAIGVIVAIFLLVLALPTIIGGWGLLNFRPWARILVIILSVFHLFHIPIGTAIGLYGLWVLLHDETRRLFQTGGHYVPPAPPAPYGPPYHPPVQAQQQPPAV